MIKAMVFDYGRTIVEAETDNLFPEAKKVLDALLQQKIKLALVSRSYHPRKRWADIRRHGSNFYFKLKDLGLNHIPFDFSLLAKSLAKQAKISHQPSVAMVANCSSSRLLTKDDLTKFVREKKKIKSAIMES